MTLRRPSPLAAALLAAVLLTAGCGADGGSDDAPQRDRPRAATKLPPPEAPSASASPDDAPSAVPTGKGEDRRIVARPTRPTKSHNALTFSSSGPDGHLLGAGDLGARWSVASTSSENGRVMSDCHRATLRDVGAQETRLRDFRGKGGSRAVQAVSRFVDGKSAWRIEQVVTSWAEDCQADLRDRDAALGAVRHGSWVSVVEVAGVDSPRQQLRSALAAVSATF